MKQKLDNRILAKLIRERIQEHKTDESIVDIDESFEDELLDKPLQGIPFMNRGRFKKELVNARKNLKGTLFMYETDIIFKYTNLQCVLNSIYYAPNSRSIVRVLKTFAKEEFEGESKLEKAISLVEELNEVDDILDAYPQYTKDLGLLTALMTAVEDALIKSVSSRVYRESAILNVELLKEHVSRLGKIRVIYTGGFDILLKDYDNGGGLPRGERIPYKMELHTERDRKLKINRYIEGKTPIYEINMPYDWPNLIISNKYESAPTKLWNTTTERENEGYINLNIHMRYVLEATLEVLNRNKKIKEIRSYLDSIKDSLISQIKGGKRLSIKYPTKLNYNKIIFQNVCREYAKELIQEVKKELSGKQEVTTQEVTTNV